MAPFAWNVQCVLVPVLVFIRSCNSKAELPTYFMNLRCDGELDMERRNITSGILKLAQGSNDISYKDCWTTIRAAPDHRVDIRILEIAITKRRQFPCDDHYIQLYDGLKNNSNPLSSKFCGTSAPRGSIASKYRNISIHFLSIDSKEDQQFQLLFTSFHWGECKGEEFRCNNGHCIDGRLNCNGFDNCGDNSDSCIQTHSGTIALVAVVILFLIACCFFFGIRRYRQNRGLIIKTNDPATVPMNPPVQPYIHQNPTSITTQYPTGGYIPPPESAQPVAQSKGQPGGYPPAPPPGPGAYPPPQGYVPPQGYAPPQGYPSQVGYQPAPPQGYPQVQGYPTPQGTAYPPPPPPPQTGQPVPYQEKPPI